MSVDFFLHNMLRNIELNVNTTNNHLALTSYFANPSFKKGDMSVLEIVHYVLVTIRKTPVKIVTFQQDTSIYQHFCYH